MNDIRIPDVSTLRRIRGIAALPDDHLIALANQLRVRTADNGKLLIEAGSTANHSLFILSGKVSLNAHDGRTREISADTTAELRPIAQLRPCIYNVKAIGTVEYLKIDRQKLAELASLSKDDSHDISLHSLFTDYDEEDQSLVNHLYHNLMENVIRLPPLPSVAARMQTVYDGRHTDPESLVQVLVPYPDVLKKLFNVAGCARNEDLDTKQKLRYSIRHLGILTVYCLVMTYAIGKLVRRLPPRHLQRVDSFWQHSLNVAAISRLLAVRGRLFSPDLSMLAGLVHGIGVLVIDDELIEHHQLMLDHLEIDHAIQVMRPEISSLLLRSWNLDDDLILVAEQCGNWARDHEGPADLCDLVLAANYCGLMKSDRDHSLPAVNRVPAMARLGVEPEDIIFALRESAREKRNIGKLFS